MMPTEEADGRAPACWALRAEQAYWDPHVDSHNVASYHVSAVLYLASQRQPCDAEEEEEVQAPQQQQQPPHTYDRGDFSGGSFAFHDADGDVTHSPVAGDTPRHLHPSPSPPTRLDLT
jgi:hypothetical protein